jgi:CBS-domain-containing membrane protein
MTDKLDGKAWATTDNLLIVLTECIIVALMTLRYLHPAVAAVVITLMLGGYLVSVFGYAARRSSAHPGNPVA